MLSFYFLGSMEVRLPGRTVTFAGTIQQTLLAALVHQDERLVTVHALIRELWGVTPPATVANSLQANIGRLRRTLARLEPERRQSRLTAVPSGYRLSLEDTEMDGRIMVETVRAVQARSGADPYRTIADLREALTLWRGPVFGGLTGGPICQEAVAVYTACRDEALVSLYEAELAVGAHAKIVPELRELVAENPLHERLSELLIIALCRSGRQTDALSMVRRLRTGLREELDVTSSPAMQRLERAIRDQDVRLRAPRPASLTR